MKNNKRQRKPTNTKTLIDKIFGSETLDPKWESKRDYLLYVRQLEQLEKDPRYIQ